MMIHYMHITFPPKTLGPGHTPDAEEGWGVSFLMQSEANIWKREPCTNVRYLYTMGPGMAAA